MFRITVASVLDVDDSASRYVNDSASQDVTDVRIQLKTFKKHLTPFPAEGLEYFWLLIKVCNWLISCFLLLNFIPGISFLNSY